MSTQGKTLSHTPCGRSNIETCLILWTTVQSFFNVICHLIHPTEVLSQYKSHFFFFTFHSTVKWVEANYWTAIKKIYLKIEGSTLAQYELTMACVGVSCNFHDWFESLFSHCCDHYAAILYREQKKKYFFNSTNTTILQKIFLLIFLHLGYPFINSEWVQHAYVWQRDRYIYTYIPYQ